MDLCKMIGNSREVSNFNRLFLKLNRFPSSGSETTSMYIKEGGDDARVTMDLRSPKGFVFLGLHHPLPWSQGCCGERGKRYSLVAKVKGA